MDNIYVKKNPDWDDKSKYGYVSGNKENLTNRLNDSKEEHSELSNFSYIFKFEKTDNYKLYKEPDKIFSIISIDINKIELIEKSYNIKLPMLKDINKYLVKSKTKKTNEFINNNGITLFIKILKEEFPLLGLKYIGEYSNEEIELINNASKERYKKEDETIHNNFFKLINKTNETNNTNKIKKINEWEVRDYQESMIEIGKKELLENGKIYIELPTGSGKSFIVYNLLNLLKCNFIIIMSPRIIVNEQNILQKYLQILEEKYDIFKYPGDFNNNNNDNFIKSKRKILICCTQSSSNLYNFIRNIQSTQNITLWFDESHWSLENWINLKDDCKNFLLYNDNIKYRIFTSASPNKSIINENIDTFGKLYTPITTKELINKKYLSEIKPYIYEEEKENVNKISFTLKTFEEKDRKFGFSFHNNINNASIMFKEHYNEYINDKTNIKPFLLVSDSKEDENISLEYNYKDIKKFESTENSIGYVVDKYSMGYDFNKLDFIVFNDPKLGSKDIIQSIGRGIRPYSYSNNNEIIYKHLILLLPVYTDDINDDNKYTKIIEVLQYLLHNIEIPFEKIEFIKKVKSENTLNSLKTNSYIGDIDLKSKLLDLLEIIEQNKNKKIMSSITYEKARKIIADKDIKSKESYYELCDNDNRLSKEPEILFKGQFTNWIDYLSIKRVYYDLETCKNKVGEYLSNETDIDFEFTNITKLLKVLDDMFPPYDLWCEYYEINDLTEIIKHNKNEELVEF